jgi:hypothetical protein
VVAVTCTGITLREAGRPAGRSKHRWSGELPFPGGVGNTEQDADRFASLIDDVEARLFDQLPSAVYVQPAGHQNVRYRELSSFTHLHWYNRGILGGVFDICRGNDEPDLTALLVTADRASSGPAVGESPEDEWEQVFAYWQERESRS